MSMRKKRSFREKLADAKDLPRVQPLTGAMKRRLGPGTIVLPAPQEVDHLMRRVPKGKVTTINHLREVLASRHAATIACPIVTGIHARIAAGAAGEAEAEGRKRITPYWRTLKQGARSTQAGCLASVGDSSRRGFAWSRAASGCSYRTMSGSWRGFHSRVRSLSPFIGTTAYTSESSTEAAS